MKAITLLLTTLTLFCLLSCNQQEEKSNALYFAPKIVEAHGYVVPKDSIAEPKMILAGKPKVVPVGNPKVVTIPTNIHPIGNPKSCCCRHTQSLHARSRLIHFPENSPCY